MPDVASRAFLAAVVEASRSWGPATAAAAAGSAPASLSSSQWQQQQQPSLPVLGLVDWNPGGVGILLAYKYGCAALGLESARQVVARVEGGFDMGDTPRVQVVRVIPRDWELPP